MKKIKIEKIKKILNKQININPMKLKGNKNKKNIKLRKINFKKIKIYNVKSKITKAIILLLVLLLFGTGVYFLKKYEQTSNYLTRKYKNEVEDVLNIGENNTLIKIIKSDLNSDGIEEYICMYAKEIYSSYGSTTNVSNTLVMYEDIKIAIIDGVTKEIVEYDSTKSFNTDVDISIKTSGDKKYIFVNSINSQDVILIRFADKNIVDIIKNSFGGTPTGYNISYKINTEEKSKITLILDNNATSYLSVKNDEYIIDFTDKNIDLNNYRHSYLKNKYSYFDFLNFDDDNELEFIGIQNVLYLNNNTEKIKNIEKTLGKVKVIFDLIDDKLIYIDVNVEM